MKPSKGSDISGTAPGSTATPPSPSRKTRVTMRVADTLTPSKLPPQPSAMTAVRKAHKGEERFERAKFALEKIGPSVFGSGLTTLGSAFFLLPCSLHVFYKIGAVVCGITVYAELFALIFLPAALMICGPSGHDSRSCLQYDLQGWDPDGLEPSVAPHILAECKHPGSPQQQRQSSTLYVLNAPVRGMAQTGPGQSAS